MFDKTTCSHARSICNSSNFPHSGMALRTPSSIRTIGEYLIKWLHKRHYGNIWMRSENGSCVVMNAKAWLPPDKPVGTQTAVEIDLTRNVICEMNETIIQKTIPKGLFHCRNGPHILDVHVCDNQTDCPYGDDEWNCACNETYFRCDDYVCIPLSKVCDFRRDCFDGSDESFCIKLACREDEFRCNNGQCIPLTQRCNFVKNCIDDSDEAGELCKGETCSGFKCYSGKCIASNKENDMVIDCSSTTHEDELLDNQKEFAYSWWKDLACENNANDVPCESHRKTCMPRSAVCIYDPQGHPQSLYNTCRTGNHLRNCKNFSCPNMFKCKDSYCIAERNVCNGRKDCPLGEDEESTICENQSCKGKFRCRNESFCLDFESVCNGIHDCPNSNDDELYCGSTCPTGCVCIGNTYQCHRFIHGRLLPRDIRALILSNTNFNLTMGTFSNFRWMIHLNISNCSISSIPAQAFKDMINLNVLDLSYNRISRLDSNSFDGLGNLNILRLKGNPIVLIKTFAFNELNIKTLNLNNLKIQTIESKAFCKMTKLRRLTLKDNKIESVGKEAFCGLPKLRYLSILNNPQFPISKDLLAGIQLLTLKADSFRFCCVANTTACVPESDGFSSCQDLMGDVFQQFMVWVMGVLSLIGNLVVIIWRLLHERNNVPSFFIINLSVSDWLMGCYLILLGTADQMYRNDYALHSDEWLSSSWCKLAGFLSTLSSQMSMYMLVIITIDRVICVVYGFQFPNWKIKMNVAVWLVAGGWLFCSFISFLPISGIPYFGNRNIITSVCLLFNFTAGWNYAGWEYATCVFLALNLAACILFIAGYGLIFTSIAKTRRAAGQKGTEEEIIMARKFLLIIGTDLICWIPVLLIGILSFFSESIQAPRGKLTAWITVFCVPINSAINPYLYSLQAFHKGCKNKRGTIAPNSSETSK